MRAHAGLQATDVVPDVGCGTGHHLRGLVGEIGRGIGVDLSPRMVEVARRQTPSHLPLGAEVDDSARLDTVGDRTIDLAPCIGALEHMPDKAAVLQNIHRVLVPGGRLFCLTPDADYLWYRALAPSIGLPTRHLSTDRFPTRDALAWLLVEAGFGTIELGTWTFVPEGDMPGPIAVLLHGLELLGRWSGMRQLRGGLWACARKDRYPATGARRAPRLP